VDYVGHLDANTYREDPEIADIIRRALQFQSLVRFYHGPPFRDSFTLGVRESDPDPSTAREVIYFGRHNASYGESRSKPRGLARR
jgi:hypothetical protein